MYEQDKVRAQLSWSWKKYYNHGACAFVVCIQLRPCFFSLWPILYGCLFSRYTIWLKNRDIIQHHNKETANGRHGYTMGMNQFADMVRLSTMLQLRSFSMYTITVLSEKSQIFASVDIEIFVVECVCVCVCVCVWGGSNTFFTSHKRFHNWTYGPPSRSF